MTRQGEEKTMNDTIGIGISKDKLDAYWLSMREHRQFSSDQKGVKALSLWAREAGIAQVIFESTGVYHRLVEAGLAEHGISFARVNPRQARRFCEGLAGWPKQTASMLPCWRRWARCSS
jgi:transposase